MIISIADLIISFTLPLICGLLFIIILRINAQIEQEHDYWETWKQSKQRDNKE